ncbi:MAG: hypothetical protein LBU61_04960 [Coriobacteriales bacterium]|jgi:hypothetical protein|nr:hypothetical protein [Coriobacteriales bacterium]
MLIRRKNTSTPATNTNAGQLSTNSAQTSKTKTRQLISMLLAIAVAFSLFVALPQQAFAYSDETELAYIINHFNPGNGGPSTGQLTAVANTTNHTVTVTGTVTGAKNTLQFEMAPGVTVIWKAYYLGSQVNGNMINITGPGCFEVQIGGTLLNSGTYDSIAAFDTTTTVKVNGGYVGALGTGCAIISAGKVEVNSGTVASTSGNTIKAYSCCPEDRPEITINGGAVRCTESGNAIYTFVDYTKIIVNGGFVYSTGTKTNIGDMSALGTMNTAISARGRETRVTINGGCVESAAMQGIAVFSTSFRIFGGEVIATGYFGSAIVSNGVGTVAILGGTVSASWFKPTIILYGYFDSLYIDNGIVSSYGPAPAILSYGDDNEIEIDGGLVIAYGSGDAIINEGNYVEIRIYNGQIVANGTGDAIHNNAVNSAKIAIDHGTVCAKSGYAIYSEKAVVNIHGGFVFAYGTSILGEGQVIRVKHALPNLLGNSMVCAWDQAAGKTTYIENTTVHLVNNTGMAENTTWGKLGDNQYGIYFSNTSANTGFFPIDEIKVVPPKPLLPFTGIPDKSIPSLEVPPLSLLDK